MKTSSIYFLGSLLFLTIQCTEINYPDQQITIRGIDQLKTQEDSSQNIFYNESTNSIELDKGFKEGLYISKPLIFSEKFNRGLPSWNGFAPEKEASSFRVSMRYKMSFDWSNWVTVGYWDKNIWSEYGATEFEGGKIDTDYTKLDAYITECQFKIEFKRENLAFEAPSIKQLNFFVSDSRTTKKLDLEKVVHDNPPAIFKKTNFVYQYGVDDTIGGSICSPSSVSMIIQSYGQPVTTYDFAQRTNDTYWDIFGVWPRVVQHAHAYGLEGKVTRYRTWSEAYNVLNNGGRIAMTVGKPLFTPHLIMLAGFDEEGNPIIHNPGQEEGYGIQYDKMKLSESWFKKGGISYTFYPDPKNELVSK